MARELGRISGIDPKVARYLEIVRENLDELNGNGASRALRIKDFSSGIFTKNRSGQYEFDTDSVVIPDQVTRLEHSLEAVRAAQTNTSTLAQELLDDARFGSVMGAVLSETKTIKVNVEGHVAGYGVAAYGNAAGGVTSDFIIQADRFSVVFPDPTWQDSFAYSQGQYVTATPNAGVQNVIFECTTAGTTGTTEPAWDTTIGNTTTSGTAVFTARTIDARVPFIVGNINGTPTVGIDGNLVVDGTILAASIGAGEVTANKLAATLILTQQIQLDTTGYIRSGQTAYDTGTGFFLSANNGTPLFSIGNSAGNKLTWDSSVLTVVGTISGALDAGSLVGSVPTAVLDLANYGWSFDGIFSALDADTVQWSAGTFESASGDTYSIAATNTGNMTARTYIYLDIAVSTTQFQVSTVSADAVGLGKVLVAIAQNGTDTPFFQVFGGRGGVNGVSFSDMEGNLDLNTQISGTLTTAFAAAGLINTNVTINADGSLSGAGAGQASLTSLPGQVQVGSIAANAVTTGTIAALQITAAKLATDSVETSKLNALSVTSAKLAAAAVTAGKIDTDAVTANEIQAGAVTAGKLAASLVLSNTIELTTTGYIRSGQTAFDTGIGFFLSANSGTPQFSLGNSGGNKITWNGSVLTVVGSISGSIDATDLTGAIPSASLDLANFGWTFDAVFSVVDADTVQWSAGTFRAANGATYSISGNNTGNMTARTYIYLDVAVSTTQLQTTTVASTPVGAGKVLIAIAEDGTDTPFFQVFGGVGGINGVDFADLEGTVNLGSQVSGTLTTAFAAAGLINTNVTINADGTLSGAGSGQASLASLPGQIATGQLAANAVTAAKIAALTITAAEIAASTITGSKIAATTIAAANIVANTITAAQIAANTITAAEIAANTITSSELAANSVTANAIAAGVITAGKLASTVAFASQALTLGTGATFSSGQSAYDTGTGWWLEYNGGTPRFSLGNSGGAKLTWDGSTLSIVGDLNLSSSQAQSWSSPTWSGYSTNPTGGFTYWDLGTHVLMARLSTSYGTSNSASCSVSGLPTALRPNSTRVGMLRLVSGGNMNYVGSFEVTAGGVINFYIINASVTGNYFITSSGKGPVNGSLMIWAK